MTDPTSAPRGRHPLTGAADDAYDPEGNPRDPLPEGWRVTLQVFATAVVGHDGECERLEPPFDLDMDFAVWLHSPWGEDFEIDHGRYLPDDAPAEAERAWQTIRAARQGPVWAPVL